MSVLGGNDVGALLNNLLALGEDHLDVAGVGHVRVDLERGSARAMTKQKRINIHDREHGKCGGAAWGPG